MEVRLYATLRAIVGSKSVDIPLGENDTALDLARRLADLHPGLTEHFFVDPVTRSEFARSVHFMIDGRNLRWLPEGAATRIDASQTIDLFPPAAGG